MKAILGTSQYDLLAGSCFLHEACSQATLREGILISSTYVYFAEVIHHVEVHGDSLNRTEEFLLDNSNLSQL